MVEGDCLVWNISEKDGLGNLSADFSGLDQFGEFDHVGIKRDVLQVGLSFHKIGPEIVDDPVGEGLGVSAALSGFLKIVAQRYVIDKHLRIAIRQLVLIHETLLAVQGKFNDTLLNLFKPFFGRLKRYEVRAWKIAIVMGILLGSHASCDTLRHHPIVGFPGEWSLRFGWLRVAEGFHTGGPFARRRSCSCF